jgi:hypothetical protein
VLDNKVGLGRYTIVRAVKVSDQINHEQKYNAALGGCQTTKNAVTNQKHLGGREEGQDLMRYWVGM